jgi:hypothetical protein
MAQISRPFQLALVVVVVLAGVWLFALQGHSSSPTTASSSPAVTSTVSTSSASATPSTTHKASATPAAGTPAHHAAGHNPAPGIEGLKRDVNKAHEAASLPQRQASEVQNKAAQGSGEAASGPGSNASSRQQPAPATSSTTTSSSPVHSGATSASATAVAKAKTQPIKSQAGSGRTPARQALVERALNEGKVAVILFWDPTGANDAIVADELAFLEHVHHLVRPLTKVASFRHELEHNGEELQKRFSAFTATASQISSFGSITRGLQVYSTPTLFIINKRGQTTVLNGLQDAFSIEQAIDEVRNAPTA